MSDLDLNIASENYSAFGKGISFAGWVSLNFSVKLRLIHKIFTEILFNPSKNIENYRVRDNKPKCFLMMKNTKIYLVKFE